MLELVVGRDSPAAPPTTLWIAIPTVGVLVLLLLARRRFPFAAPAGYWLLAAAISFGDGVLLAFVGSLSIVGLASAFLLGNLRNPLKAGAGLIIVLVGIVIVVYNIPGETASDLVFIPSVRGRLGRGLRARERAEQAEAAEMRAALAEGERDAAARVAVAEERARIARELRDIVAHAMSVMVLQVGAVRTSSRRSRRTGTPSGASSEPAAGRSRRCAASSERCAATATGSTLQPGLDGLDRCWKTSAAQGFPASCTWKVILSSFRARSTSRRIESSRRALTNSLKHANATRADVTVRYRDDELGIEVVDRRRRRRDQRRARPRARGHP